MRILAVLGVALLMGCVSQPAPPSADVALDLKTRRNGATDIKVTVKGDPDGQTVLAVGADFGFTAPSPEMFEPLKVTCEGPCETTLSRDDLILSVRHEPGAIITVSHRLERKSELDDVDDYRAFADPSGVLLFSPISLFLPQQRSGELDVAIHWSVPRYWKAFGPFGPGNRTRGQLSSAELSNLLLAAGPHAALGGEHGAYFGVIAFDPDTAEPNDILARVDPILATTRALFPGTEESWYFVTAAAAGEQYENGFALGGTAVRSAFALYVSPGMDLDRFAGVLDSVVAHEYFHNWNGVLFFLDGGGEHHARWFVEGFTEFYARKIALAAGATTVDDYLHHLNEQISFYQSSDVRDLGIDAMVKLWEANDPRAELSYKRGDLLALYVDEAVRKMSGGERSLDDMMRLFAARARRGLPDPTPEDVFAWIETNASTEVMQNVRSVVERGGEVPMPRRIHEPDLILSPDGSSYKLAN